MSCDCIHGEGVHDRITGACHFVNLIHGPCPCAATPDAVRKAQHEAWMCHRSKLTVDGRLVLGPYEERVEEFRVSGDDSPSATTYVMEP